MSECLSCLDLFQNGQYNDRKLQIEVDQNFPEFLCENEKCSSKSPGIIEHEENLAFLLIEPIHFDDQTGLIAPDAFQEITNRDLSLLRKKHCTSKIASETKDKLSTARLPDQHRYIDKVCLTKAAKIREILHEDKRVMGIYDTALEDNPSHASIFTTAEMLSTKPRRRQIRRICHKLLTQEVCDFSTFAAQLP